MSTFTPFFNNVDVTFSSFQWTSILLQCTPSGMDISYRIFMLSNCIRSGESNLTVSRRNLMMAQNLFSFREPKISRPVQEIWYP